MPGPAHPAGHLPRRPRRRPTTTSSGSRTCPATGASACCTTSSAAARASTCAPGPRFWTVDLFLRELDALVRHLGHRRPLPPARPVLGRDAGDGARARPSAGAASSIVVCDSPASMPLWVEEANRLRADLPAGRPGHADRHEATGTTADPAYEQATTSSTAATCAASPVAGGVQRRRSPRWRDDPTVYHTMNGPSEFHCVGSYGLGHHRPAAGDRRADAARVRAATTRPPRASSSRSHRGIPVAAGCCSTTRATCRTSRSPSAFRAGGRGLPGGGRPGVAAGPACNLHAILLSA